MMKKLLFLLFLPISLPAQDIHIAAYYYPWYGNKHWKAGYIRQQLDPPQQPLLGEYKSQDKAVIRQHQQWSEAYGIDSWICSWWGRRKKTDRVLRKRVLRQLEGTETQMAIFYESAGLLGMKRGRIRIENEDVEQLTDDIRYLAKHYFGHPSYLKINNKPVLFIYLARALYGQVEEALQAVRATAREAGYELYLVGDEAFWQRPKVQHIQLLDAITPYNMHGPGQYDGYPAQTGFLEDVARQYQKYQYVAEKCNTAFIPNAFSGFNDKGVRPEARHYAIPPQVHPDSSHLSTFRQYLKTAQLYIDPDLKMLTITSFNEWHEDTQVEPAVVKPGFGPVGGLKYPAYGLGLLEVIKSFKNKTKWH